MRKLPRSAVRWTAVGAALGAVGMAVYAAPALSAPVDGRSAANRVLAEDPVTAASAAPAADRTGDGQRRPDAARHPVRCALHQLSVSLPAALALPLPQRISGQLCVPADRRPTAVQLLLSGGTYNRKYWDLPYQPENFSYQRDMAAHGYATFAIDRLGTGASSKPPSALLLATAEAATVHQVVGQLRAGRVGPAFRRVILVGHSMGSGLTVLAAANHHDVDAVILTGMTHIPAVAEVAGGLALKVHPVTLDPQLSRRGSDPGYITTRPGARGDLFYAPHDRVPGAVAADEQYAKDQLAAVSLTDTLALGLVSPVSRSINVPVLMANGSQDSLFCGPPLARDCSSAGALQAQEAPYFSAAADLAVHVLPGVGHSLALSAGSDQLRTGVRSWLTQRQLV